MSTAFRKKFHSAHVTPDWHIDGIVAELRAVRNQSLAARCRAGKHVLLPSRSAIMAIIDSLSKALFPNRLGSHSLMSENVDFFVGHTLDLALRDLSVQVLRELQFIAGNEQARDEQREQMIEIVREFARRLPAIRPALVSDTRAAYEADAAARTMDEVIACYPGITAITHHRLAHALCSLELPLIARMVAEIAHSITGIDIHPGARIGSCFFIDHGTGVVVGETAVIGKRVRLHHGVTLGAKTYQGEDGDSARGLARHPSVEDDVVIYSGATILGPVTIGRGSVIGGNVWLTRSVAAGSRIFQAQVRTESFDAGHGI